MAIDMILTEMENNKLSLKVEHKVQCIQLGQLYVAAKNNLQQILWRLMANSNLRKYIGMGLKSNVSIRWHLLTSYQSFGSFPKKLDEVKIGKKAF